MAAAPPGGPPLRIRLIGQAMTRLIAAFPASWRLLRGPTERLWDRNAAGWNERMRPSSQRLAALDAALAEAGGEPQRILEIGTGTGLGARHLAERLPGAHITGVDLSEEMVRVARAGVTAPNVEFRRADASALPFPDASFDLVFQVNVPVFFAEVARVLAPGGRAIVVATLGAATPYHTPDRQLRRGFARAGMSQVARGQAGTGTYFVASR